MENGNGRGGSEIGRLRDAISVAIQFFNFSIFQLFDATAFVSAGRINRLRPFHAPSEFRPSAEITWNNTPTAR